MRLVDTDEIVEALDEVLEEQTEHADAMDALKKKLLVGFAKQILSDAPTVDAVKVVRCKDCMYGVDYDHDGDCYCLSPKWGLMYFGGDWDFYCAGAKRKEDGKIG